jgi:O-antigen ligase
MGIMFFIFILKKALKREKLFINTVINLPFLFLILLSIISFKNSIDYAASLRGMARIVQNAFLVLICAEEIKDRKHVSLVVSAIILGAALASADALWQIKFGKDFIRGNVPHIKIGLSRATSAFPNPNVLGVYLSALSPLVIGLALYYFKGTKKVLMLFISLLVTLGIVLTFSRGTALAFYVSILFLSILRKNKIISFSLIILLLIFFFVMPQNIKDWAKKINYNPIVFMLNIDRISIYKNTLNMIKHHPLIGVGVNTFSKNYLQYKLPEIGEDAKTGDSMYAHNHFLHMAGEIGLLGLAVFVWLLIRLFKRNFHVYKNLDSDFYQITLLSLIACLIAFLVNGLTETSLYYSRVAMIFWYLTGFSLAFARFINVNHSGKD